MGLLLSVYIFVALFKVYNIISLSLNAIRSNTRIFKCLKIMKFHKHFFRFPKESKIQNHCTAIKAVIKSIPVYESVIKRERSTPLHG